MRLDDLVRYLDEYLRIGDVADERNAVNGLQVENAGEVSRLAAAVDACQVTIDAAAELGADFLLVHHGLLWGGLEPLAGRTYRRFSALIRHDIAVYSSHAPLDRHPEVGNNAVLARKLGVDVRGWFGDYLGAPVGAWGEVDLTREALRDGLSTVLSGPVRMVAGGPSLCRRVGIVAGSGGSYVRQAHEAGLDSLVTGEGRHWAYFDAEELGLNVFLGGHYATETFGVRALAEHLSQRFRLPWSFIDHPTGL